MSAKGPEVVGQVPRFMRYRYLLGAMQQREIAMTVRFLCIPEDVQRLPEIQDRWRGASRRMQELAGADVDAVARVAIEDPPATVRARIAEIQADALFQASFSHVPSDIR